MRGDFVNKKKNSIIQIVCIVIVVVSIVIGYVYYNNNSENYNSVKIDKSQYLVYTKSKQQSGYYNQYKPFLNVKGEVADQVNNDIDLYFSNFDKDNVCITYEYDLNGKVLSLVIKVEDYSYVDSAAVLYFRSYNIKLDSMEILSNEKILSYFNMNSSDVEVKLDEKIKEYYYKLVGSAVIDEKECNYDCFIQARNFEPGTEDNEYYVRNGKLVVFKPYIFMTSTDSDEEIVYDFELE